MGLPDLVARVLLARGMDDPQQVRNHMRPDLGQLHSPFLFTGMQRAVERIKSAVRSGESILILGDYDVDGISGSVLLLQFFALRAIPGVEAVDGSSYQRTFLIDGARGTVRIELAKGAPALTARVETDDPRVLPKLVTKLRRQFDLRADPAEISEHLRRDARLATAYPEADGLRLPGAFDGFEVAVRGILGQQVTVKGATTISGRIVERCGTPSGDGSPSVDPVRAGAPRRPGGYPGARAGDKHDRVPAVRRPDPGSGHPHDRRGPGVGDGRTGE